MHFDKISQRNRSVIKRYTSIRPFRESWYVLAPYALQEMNLLKCI